MRVPFPNTFRGGKSASLNFFSISTMCMPQVAYREGGLFVSTGVRFPQPATHRTSTRFQVAHVILVLSSPRLYGASNRTCSHSGSNPPSMCGLSSIRYRPLTSVLSFVTTRWLINSEPKLFPTEVYFSDTQRGFLESGEVQIHSS